MFSTTAHAVDAESALVRLAQTGVDGSFSLALVSELAVDLNNTGAQDLRKLTSLCKQIRVFGKVQPNSDAALRHDAAMVLLKQAATSQKPMRFQFADASLKVANKTLPCALRSHGLFVEKAPIGDMFRFAAMVSTPASATRTIEKSNMAVKPIVSAKPVRPQ